MDLAKLFVEFLVQGGNSAIVVILVAIIGALIWDRKHILKEMNEITDKYVGAKDHELEATRQIIERYHQGNIDLIHALHEIKIVLTSFQAAKK